MKNRTNISRLNVHLARATWGDLSQGRYIQSQDFERRLCPVGSSWAISSSWRPMVRNARRLAPNSPAQSLPRNQNHCSKGLSDPAASRWVFKATVYKSPRSRGFVGYGDADPSNVSSLVHGAEMRVAETRAVNRALRKAYGIGLCSVEELGWAPRSNASGPSDQRKPSTNGNNGHQNGQPRLRDRLCLLIRQHQLDAGLVKAYAADYCGTPTLRDASRDQVEAFINDLAERAAKDRDGLICQLNSYSKSQEVAP